jgi:N-acetylglutamate synthase-like GNAT family acetyltransferase
MITIGFLADYSETIPTLAKWFREQWPGYFGDWSDEEMAADFLEDCSRERLPIRLVAFVSGELAGTIVLRENGNEALRDYQPELGGLYVDGVQRDLGVGSELVAAGMAVARELGFEVVYATTVNAKGILERQGWEFIKTAVKEDGELSLYRCDL